MDSTNNFESSLSRDRETETDRERETERAARGYERFSRFREPTEIKKRPSRGVDLNLPDVDKGNKARRLLCAIISGFYLRRCFQFVKMTRDGELSERIRIVSETFYWLQCYTYHWIISYKCSISVKNVLIVLWGIDATNLGQSFPQSHTARVQRPALLLLLSPLSRCHSLSPDYPR